MNILILTGQFGMGHMSTAQAIREQIALRNPEAHVHTADIIEDLFPELSRTIYGNFNFWVKYCPFIYNTVNNLAGQFGDVPMKRAMAKKVDALLSAHQVDLVIATLPVCSRYISAYKELTGSRIPLFTYVTDITIHDEWIAKNTDRYFVGSESTKNSLISKGVPAGNITISGIPVRADFYHPAAIDETHRPARVLIMGGGLGLIPLRERFLQRLSANPLVQVTVITGKNEKLRRRLEKHCSNVQIIGYTTRVSDYLRQADVVVTKSGGITTFEAIHMQCPLYVLKPFLMQEMGNAQYIEQQNIGRVMWSDRDDPVQDILSLLENPELLAQMRRNMAQLQTQWVSGYAPDYLTETVMPA